MSTDKKNIPVCPDCESINQCQHCGHCTKCCAVEIEQLKAERDKARRMYCNLEMVKGDPPHEKAVVIAHRLNWDCFESEGE